MQINKKADFVLKGNKVLHPPVRTDGLELYYDTKGKKNTDTYKDKLLDMSGNDRHGELHNFSYKNLSGYQEDSELVFDGVDDKLVLGDVEEPEIISATKNLFDNSQVKQDVYLASNGAEYNDTGSSLALNYIRVQPNKTYTWNNGIDKRIIINTYDENKRHIERILTYSGGVLHSLTIESNVHYIRVSSYNSGNYDFSDFQFEEGSAATPYVPYIPSIRGTYQINNNIISYDGDIVRWVKDGKVVEQKGINLVSNGNFHNGMKGWSFYQNPPKVNGNKATFHRTGKDEKDIIALQNPNITLTNNSKTYLSLDVNIKKNVRKSYSDK